VLNALVPPIVTPCSSVIGTHTAVITVVCLALLIFSLIERQVASALRAHGRTTGVGLYASQPAVLTTRLIFQAHTGLRPISTTNANPHTIPRPTSRSRSPWNTRITPRSMTTWPGGPALGWAGLGACRRKTSIWGICKIAHHPSSLISRSLAFR
jgi:hypothetical protein